MRNLLKVFFLISVVLLFFPAFSKSNGINGKSLPQDAKKAQYIYYEAVNRMNQDDNSSFYSLISRAYELDTTNTAIGYYKGYADLMLNDKGLLNQSLSLMKRHAAKYPKDYYENYTYGILCGKVGKNDDAIFILNRLASNFPNRIEVQYDLADAYAAKNDFSKAINVYDSLEQKEGVSMPISLKKIKLYLSLNDSTSAIKEAVGLHKAYPSNIENIGLLGDLFLQLGNPDSALYYYNKMSDIDAKSGVAELSKAEYYKYIGDSANYDKYIYKSLINETLPIESRLGILSDFIAQVINQESDSSKRIITLFDAMISQYPHEAAVHRLYGRYLAHTKQYASAAEQFGYVLDIEPASEVDCMSLMEVNLLHDNYKGAIAAGNKFLEYSPGNMNVYAYLAPAYGQDKQFDKAIETYKRAINSSDTISPGVLSRFYGGLADTYSLMEDSVNALQSYETAIKYDNGNIGTLNNFAYYLITHNGDYNKAEKMSALTISADPDNTTFLDTYAWVFFMKKNYSLAKMYIEKAIGLEGEDGSYELYEHYGDILFMNGEPDAAVVQWKKALSLNPSVELLQRKVKYKTYFYK